VPEDSDARIYNFSLSNASGVGQGDVAKLLRSLANHVESLGAVHVQDITFHTELTPDEDDLTFTVYYYPSDGS